jgi:hypothetical protein
MADRPAADEIAKWNRFFGAECNNTAWDLAERAERTPAEDQDMLSRAYAAAYHWSQAGGALQNGMADVLLAHVHALLRHPDQALAHARAALAFTEKYEGEGWEGAFAHAEMAYAAAVAGDAEMHAQHYALAQQAGDALPEGEDRTIFFDTFARIPKGLISD